RSPRKRLASDPRAARDPCVAAASDPFLFFAAPPPAFRPVSGVFAPLQPFSSISPPLIVVHFFGPIILAGATLRRRAYLSIP
ncbi:MAG: hypothetical protein LBK99_22405, partial [Opitutaceae bacterium]|nr:hypothetical protein [Opitutaceae bacterium]